MPKVHFVDTCLCVAFFIHIEPEESCIARPTILSGPTVGSEETMTAAIYDQHGDESVIEITERMMRPTAGADELLVMVLSCGINPIDVRKAARK